MLSCHASSVLAMPRTDRHISGRQALWDSEQQLDRETLQPLPIPFSPAFHPGHLIDNPEGEPILIPAAFECG